MSTSGGVLSVPERVFSRRNVSKTDKDDIGESTAIELQNRPTHIQDNSTQPGLTEQPSVAGTTASQKSKSRLVRTWRAHVSIRVDPSKRRDHLALERTFLAYLRTSLALSVAGTTIGQLLHLTDPQLAKGLYAGFVAGAVVVLLMGAIRFWRQQVAMSEHGKVHAGGFEMFVIFVTFLALTVTTLVTTIVVIGFEEMD